MIDVRLGSVLWPRQACDKVGELAMVDVSRCGGAPMADDRKKRGEPDRSTINLNEDYEKDYWKKKFKVSGQALAGAVRAVGKSAKKVEAYLKDK
jgi:hypothetical protein